MAHRAYGPDFMVHSIGQEAGTETDACKGQFRKFGQPTSAPLLAVYRF